MRIILGAGETKFEGCISTQQYELNILLESDWLKKYNYKDFAEVFERAGFKVNLLEYCDENKKFHYTYWNEEDGKIGRSYRFDTRNSENELKMVSIIIDAKKEVVI